MAFWGGNRRPVGTAEDEKSNTGATLVRLQLVSGIVTVGQAVKWPGFYSFVGILGVPVRFDGPSANAGERGGVPLYVPLNLR
jgi:hypothetical protein